MIRYILPIILLLNTYSHSFSEIIILKNCDSKNDGFEKNDYTLDLDKSLMVRDFIYDKKTYNKYRLTDIKTKKSNSITRFIYQEKDLILTDKIGYPQFYTQLVFQKNNPLIRIRTVVNNEIGLSNLSICKTTEVFRSES